MGEIIMQILSSEPSDYTSIDKITISNFFLPASNPAGHKNSPLQKQRGTPWLICLVPYKG